jgi:ABC transport system ATP-binding/permease protein
MTALLGIHSLSKAFGTQHLFSNISFTVSQGDRIGLIGPNGSGKSTLLKILMSLEEPDSGSISRRQGLRCGYASQSPEFPSLPLETILVSHIAEGDNEELSTRARILLGKSQFTDFSQSAASLSGGWKKRLDIARAYMEEPDLLLFDEPTNHLDLEGIFWLEKLLTKEKGSYIIVSHDRYFLENVCNKIIEFNKCYPNGVFIAEGNMSAFMERKKAFLEAQAQRQRGLAAVVREETEWLKRSPKARTSKSRSRIQKTYELMEELSGISTRNTTRTVNLEFSASERETRKLLAAKNLSKCIGDKQLFKGIDLVLSPGSRLGIVGKNGTGKTTLLKVLSGMIPQDSGTVKYADALKLVYFDQHREQLPSHLTLREALSPNGDQVNYRGQMIHVNGWAKKFLFSPDRLELPIQYLSGGERARILISKLMLEPADILFLDEPTNDLDIATLEVIEESLLEFAGAVVLISHDRCLMDRLCTQILGLGAGNEQSFFADYSQWLQSCEQSTEKKETKQKSISQSTTQKQQKLVYKEQRELDGMEEAILSIEEKISLLQQKLENNAVQSDSQKTLEAYRQLAEAQERREALYARWLFLEEKSRSFDSR